RSRMVKLTGNAKAAFMTREVVCPSGDVENALSDPTKVSLSGSCESGLYMNLFQLQSTSTDVTVSITNLIGFDPTNATNYGVMICDSSTNTIEMCTKATAAHIPTMTIVTSKTYVKFTVPNTFPSYPAGTANQGQGLTFYVITQQPTPLPTTLPRIGIH